MKQLDIGQLQVLQARPRVSGSRIGAIVAMRRGPIVDFAGNPFGPQPARVVSSLAGHVLSAACEARLPVLLVFEDDDPARPVIVDVVIDHPLRPSTDDELPLARIDDAAAPTGRPDVVSHGTARIAAITGIADGVVSVETDDGASIAARTAIALRNLKDPVVVLDMADGSAVIVGQVYEQVPVAGSGAPGADVVLQGRRVRIEAEVELILTAGACTVHLDARGKVLTKADQIVSRARGANKVQGGSVQLN